MRAKAGTFKNMQNEFPLQSIVSLGHIELNRLQTTLARILGH